MAISVTDCSSNNNASGATVITPAFSAPAGVLLSAATSEGNTTGVGGSVADSSSNNYTSAASILLNNVAANGQSQIWYFNQNAATVTSITYTKATSGTRANVSAFYATGITTASNPLDTSVKATAFGSSAAPSVASGTPSAASLLAAFTSGTSNSITWATDSGNGWAIPYDGVNRVSNGGVGGTQVSSSAKTFAPSTGAVSTTWGSMVVGFLPPPSPKGGGDITQMVVDAHRICFQG